jgi:hypothetical protein
MDLVTLPGKILTMKIKIIGGIVAFLVIGLITLFLIASYTYSEGYRAGLLTKFSHKGLMFKTYEGDINIGGITSAAPTINVNTIWHFSVLDKLTAEKLMGMEGKYVRLHYKQRIKTFFWQGETDYFVDEVEAVK